MDLKAQRKEEATYVAACRKEVVTQIRPQWDIEHYRKEEEKLKKVEEASAKEAFKQRKKSKAIRESGERRHALMQNPPPLPSPRLRIVPFCRYLLPVYKENMARRLAKWRCIKYGGNIVEIQPYVAPPWIHKCHLRYANS